MSGRYLLDTNIVIALIGQDEAVLHRLADAEDVFLCSIVLGELHYGARNSGRVAENVARIESLQAATAVLVCDATTAAFYGRVKAALRHAGTPIPENDIWIAALAHQYALSVASRDEHFAHVKGILLETW